MTTEQNDRQAAIAAVWTNAPTADVTLPQKVTEGRKEDATVLAEGTVTINKLWDAPIEILRGYAHRQLVLDAQKTVKAAIFHNQDAKNADNQKPVPSFTEAYNQLLDQFPTVSGVTPAASPKRAPKAPTKEELMFAEVAAAQAAGAKPAAIMAIIQKYTAAAEEAGTEG